MRSKSIILLALALGCGLVASIGISQVMDRNKTPADQGDKQAVFVALADIKTNEPLTAQNIKLEEWPKTIVPAGALTKLEEVEGKRSRMKIYAGEPILTSKLLGANDQTGAATQIPEGYRVAHVKVDSITGGSNLIMPGDRVDVLVFRNTNNDLNAMAAKIVLQDIKVFAVDTQTETEFTRNKEDHAEPMSAKIIQLLVTPQQAVILHAASEISGSVVRLVLRNPEDDTHVGSQGATIGDIFGPDQHSNRKAELGQKENDDLAAFLNQPKEAKEPLPAEPPSAPRAPTPPRRMIVIRGSDVAQVDFPSDGALPSSLPPINSPNGPSGPPSQFTGAPGDGPISMEPPQSDPAEDSQDE